MFRNLKPHIRCNAGLKARHNAIFATLHPQVEAVKGSPVAQLTVGTSVLGLLVTGSLGSAAGLLGAWIGSRPLTHAVAGSLACVATLDEAIERAVSRLPGAATDVQADQKPRTPRRKRPGKVQGQLAGVPAGA
jgi:hypothetical protein